MNTEAIILLLISFALSGFGLWRYPFRHLDAIERAFCSVFFVFVIASVASLGAVRLAAYSLPLVATTTVVAAWLWAFCAHLKLQTNTHIEAQTDNVSMLAVVSLIIILITMLVFYSAFPTYFMLGGRDQGIYLLLAKHIATTGGLEFHLPASASSLQQLDASFNGVIHNRYPGFYNAHARGLSSDPTLIIAQFQHLYPSFAALFYNAAGLWGLVRVNALTTVLALWGFFVIARRLVGQWPAIVAVIALAIDPAIIWAARITLTEIVSMTLLFGGLVFSWLALERRSKAWGLVAGIVLGFSLLNRIDGVFASLVVLGVVIYAVIKRDRLRSIAAFTAVGYLIASTIGILDCYYNSNPYWHDLWHSGTMVALVRLNFVITGLFALTLLIPNRKKLIARIKEHILPFSAFTGVFILAVWMVFTYWLLPRTSINFGFGIERLASLRLSWYVSPAAYPLFLIGLFLCTRTQRWKYYLPLLLITGGAVFVYTYNPHISSDLIWATRRWVPYTIPLITLFAVVCLVEVWRQMPWKIIRILTIGASIAIFGYYSWHSYANAKPFAFQSMLSSYPADYQKLAEKAKDAFGTYFSHHDGKHWAVTSDPQIASYLTYFYNVPTLWANRQKIDWQRKLQGHPLIGRMLPSLRLKTITRDRLCGFYLTLTYTAVPGHLYIRCYGASLAWIEHYDQDSPEIVSYPAANPLMYTLVGERNFNNETVMSTGRGGQLLYGPYVPLKPGFYRVTWKGDIQEWAGMPLGALITTPAISIKQHNTKSIIRKKDPVHKENEQVFRTPLGYVDVSANTGSNRIARAPLFKSCGKTMEHCLAQLVFYTAVPLKRVEFRVWVNRNVFLAVKKINVEKLD